jgi:aminoglycoside phosphotransferase (APT) family kinase protein
MLTGSLSPGWAEQYLRRRLPEADPRISDVTLRALRKMPRGVSRETWLAETVVTRTDGSSLDYPLTIRRDHEIGSIDSVASLRFEYEVYRNLTDTAVPVARALWFAGAEDDPAGRPHYVREHVAGDWDIPHYRDPDPRYDELRITTSKRFLDALAAVHTLDWERAGFGALLDVPSGPADCAPTALRRELTGVDPDLVRSYPVAVEGIHALRASYPPPPARPVLCKGTNGLGEEIWRDGRLVAMSDWESCSVGDPAGDFARMQEMTPTILDADGTERWGLGPALQYYTEVSGITIDPDSLHWYTELYGLSVLRYGLAGVSAVRAGSPLARMSWNATDTLMMGLVRLAGTAGISPLPGVGGGLRS